nr:hypothetical protein [Tanacetum cinerariifolium]
MHSSVLCPTCSWNSQNFLLFIFSTGVAIGGGVLSLPLSKAKISFADFVRSVNLSPSCCFYAGSVFFRTWLEAATSPLRNAVVTLIISSTDFRMLSCRRLISSGFVIPCMNPNILMHSGAPLTCLLSALNLYTKSSVDSSSLCLMCCPRIPKLSECADTLFFLPPSLLTTPPSLLPLPTGLCLGDSDLLRLILEKTLYYQRAASDSGLFEFFTTCSFPLPTMFHTADVGRLGICSFAHELIAGSKAGIPFPYPRTKHAKIS